MSQLSITTYIELTFTRKINIHTKLLHFLFTVRHYKIQISTIIRRRDIEPRFCQATDCWVFVGIQSIRINVLAAPGKWCLETARGLMRALEGDTRENFTLEEETHGHNKSSLCVRIILAYCQHHDIDTKDNVSWYIPLQGYT